MIKLSVQIMAHQQRAHFVEELLQKLALGPDNVTWDRKEDRWDTGRRAWQNHDPEATHHLVLQDDALVCRDLIPGLEQALVHVPNEAIVSPFVGTRRPARARIVAAVNKANTQNASWIVLGPLNWGIGIIAPTWVIQEMLTWCEKQKYPNYDKRVGQFFRHGGRTWPTWHTWPNLVDHRDTPSLVGHGDGRVSHKFIGEEASALDVNWAGPVVDVSRPVYLVGNYPNLDRTVSRGVQGAVERKRTWRHLKG